MEAKYREVGDQFEAMMLQNFYRQMRDSSRLINMGDDNPFAPSNGEQIFQAMRDDAMMGKIAAQHPIGISDLVVNQLRGYNKARGPVSALQRRLEHGKEAPVGATESAKRDTVRSAKQ